jgi:hypothetical protein
VQSRLRDRRKKQVGPRQAPKHLALHARRYSGHHQSGSRAIHRSRPATCELVQSTAAQSSARKALVNLRNAERQDKRFGSLTSFEVSNALPQFENNGLRTCLGHGCSSFRFKFPHCATAHMFLICSLDECESTRMYRVNIPIRRQSILELAEKTSTNQTNSWSIATVSKMSSMRKNTYNQLTIREFRDPIISVECLACDRRADLDRQALVKQYGASLSFEQLRRRMSMGCPRMVSLDGIDRCQTRFPGLIDARMPLEAADGERPQMRRRLRHTP